MSKGWTYDDKVELHVHLSGTVVTIRDVTFGTAVSLIAYWHNIRKDPEAKKNVGQSTALGFNEILEDGGAKDYVLAFGWEFVTAMQIGGPNPEVLVTWKEGEGPNT